MRADFSKPRLKFLAEWSILKIQLDHQYGFILTLGSKKKDFTIPMMFHYHKLERGWTVFLADVETLATRGMILTLYTKPLPAKEIIRYVIDPLQDSVTETGISYKHKASEILYDFITDENHEVEENETDHDNG